MDDVQSAEMIFFFILYGITGVVPLMAAVYLLLRRGNAFAPGVTPPVRLRRWAAAFFAVAALGHVWWYLFYVYSRDLHSACYVVVAVLDGVALLTTIAGTLLAMLQDEEMVLLISPMNIMQEFKLKKLQKKSGWPDDPVLMRKFKKLDKKRVYVYYHLSESIAQPAESDGAEGTPQP